MAMSLQIAVRARISQGAQSVERARHRMRVGLPDVARHRERLASSIRHALRAVRRAVERRDERVTGWSNQLRSLDPRATLARGYAVVQLRDGKQAVTSVSQVKGKAKLDVHVKDGKFPAEVSRQYGF